MKIEILIPDLKNIAIKGIELYLDGVMQEIIGLYDLDGNERFENATRIRIHFKNGSVKTYRVSKKLRIIEKQGYVLALCGEVKE